MARRIKVKVNDNETGLTALAQSNIELLKAAFACAMVSGIEYIPDYPKNITDSGSYVLEFERFRRGPNRFKEETRLFRLRIEVIRGGPNKGQIAVRKIRGGINYAGTSTNIPEPTESGPAEDGGQTI